MTKGNAKVQVSYRILPENHKWLKIKAVHEERSANYILDRLITEARKADEKEGAGYADKH